MREKFCTACGAMLPLELFYRDSRRPDGRRARCKECVNADERERRRTPAFRERRAAYFRRARTSATAKAAALRHFAATVKKYPKAVKARAALGTAIALGKITRPARCERCRGLPTPGRDGRSGLHGHHHHGYDNPLDVVWLCHKCHKQEHATGQQSADAVLAKIATEGL